VLIKKQYLKSLMIEEERTVFCDKRFRKQQGCKPDTHTSVKNTRRSHLTLHFDGEVMVQINDYLQANDMFFAELLKRAVVEFIADKDK